MNASEQTDLPVKPLNTRKHAKFARKLPEYEPIYDTDNRAIKRWIRTGKQLNDLPPLDDPPAMAGWWARCMNHRVPDKLLALARPGAPSQELPSDKGEQKGTGSAARDFSDVQGLDIAANVASLRKTHAINAKLLDEAMAAEQPSETSITLRQRNYENTFELLRKAEQTLIDLQKKHGQLIDAEEARAEIEQAFETLKTMRETMTDNILGELEKLLPRRLSRIFTALKVYLLPAIEKVRLSEEQIFRNLQTINGPDTVRELLAA